MKHLFLIVIVLFGINPATADKGSVNREQAENQHELGKAYHKAGLYDLALKAYQKSYELHPRAAELINIGVCYESLGDYQRAVEQYQKYLELEPRGPHSLDVRATLKYLQPKVAPEKSTSTGHAEETRSPPVPQVVAAPVAPPSTCEDVRMCAELCTLKKNASACERAATFALDAPGGQQDGAAVSYLTQGCLAGSNDSCYRGARMYYDGTAVNKDYARSTELFLAGCKRGHQDSCARLAWIYDKGVIGKPDPVNAVPYFQSSCAAGVALGCFGLGLVLERGNPLPASLPQAVRNYEIACSGGEVQACVDAARIRTEGKGVPKDVPRAISLLERACAASISNACRRIADLDIARAAPMLLKACQLGDKDACGKLAQSADITTNIDVLTRACHESQLVDVCWRVAQHYAFELKDLPKAATFYDRACDANHPQSCAALGKLHEGGKGVEKDPVQALRLYERACALNVGESCFALSRIQVERDEGAAAFASRRRACDLGFAPACR